MKTPAILGVAALALAPASIALAGDVSPLILDVDVSNLASFDGQGDLDNAVLTLDLPAGYDTVIGVGWDVTLETVGPSWASEATISFAGLNGAELFVSPAAGIDAPLDAPENFTSNGILDLTDAGLTDISVGDGGTLSLELFESFDDTADEADALWLDGSTISVQIIPAPGAVALLGLAGLVGTRRRRG